MDVVEVSACGVVSSNRNPIEPGTRVRRVAFIERDGPRYSGVVESIEWSATSTPTVVVKMDEGGVQRFGTEWTADGPWEPEAPFKSRWLNVIGPRGAIL